MKFKKCNQTPLGIYPIVDSASKLLPLYECGITTAQLRIKTKPIYEVEVEVIEGIKISQQFNARLFINDYWQLAIKHKAYGVHLGQEDIYTADIKAIYEANICLGVSSHTPKEIGIALEIEPSYLAIGPIFETNSKKMVYDSVGVDNLKLWAKEVSYPIVAIGGINIGNIKEVALSKSANGIAMISDVLEDGKVSKKRTLALIEAFNQYAL